ncbi:transposase-like protein [Paraburkholderia sp. UCT70]
MSKLKSLEELFAGRHFDRDVIILCVRWYARYKLSQHDQVEMMAERGLSLADTTVLRWVRLCAGVRQTVELLWQVHRPVVACRRV